MTDKPGDTSPMIRYDSDYEKKKKNSSRPSLKQTQAMQARNRGGY